MDMKDKRPWTQEPWMVEEKSIYALRDKGHGANQINTMYAQFQHCRGGADDNENIANAKLASKAPEMAEILIDYIRIGKARIDIDIAMDELNDIFQRAIILLKDIGYEENQKSAD